MYCTFGRKGKSQTKPSFQSTPEFLGWGKNLPRPNEHRGGMRSDYNLYGMTVHLQQPRSIVREELHEKYYAGGKP